MTPGTLSIPGLLRRSLLHRRARSLSALVALTVSATVATALITLYDDLDAKLHHEFRSFGANIVVTAASTGELSSGPAPLAPDTTPGEGLTPAPPIPHPRRRRSRCPRRSLRLRRRHHRPRHPRRRRRH